MSNTFELPHLEVYFLWYNSRRISLQVLQKYFGDDCQVGLQRDRLCSGTILFPLVEINRDYSAFFPPPAAFCSHRLGMLPAAVMLLLTVRLLIFYLFPSTHRPT